MATLLRAILRDEIVAVYGKRRKDEKPTIDANGELVLKQSDDVDWERIIVLVNKAVAAIVKRMSAIAHYENMESNKMSALILAAQNADNLCRMDPAWHPWL